MTKSDDKGNASGNPENVFHDFYGSSEPIPLDKIDANHKLLRSDFDGHFESYQTFRRSSWDAVRKYMAVFFGMVWCASNDENSLAALKQDYRPKRIFFKKTDDACAIVGKIVAADEDEESGYNQKQASANNLVFKFAMSKLKGCKTNQEAAVGFYDLCNEKGGLEKMRLKPITVAKNKHAKPTYTAEEIVEHQTEGDNLVKTLPELGTVSVPEDSVDGEGQVVLLLGVTGPGNTVRVTYCLGTSLTSEARTLLGQAPEAKIKKLMEREPVLDPIAGALELAGEILEEQAAELVGEAV